MILKRAEPVSLVLASASVVASKGLEYVPVSEIRIELLWKSWLR